MTNGVGFRSERGPLLLAMMVATGLVAIDSTVIATAVPSIVDDLGGFSSFPWLFSVYLLASAVTVPVYAKLADTIGRKPLILWGIGVFLLGSILCGLAWDMPSLIAFRAVQGIGGGAILPITITMIGDLYTLEERARVQGYLASVWAIAAVAGPTLGGIFAQLDLWRGIFFINIPLCLLAGWMIWTRFREKVEKRQHRIDIAGAVLLTASMTLLILGVLQGGHAWDWNSVPSLVVLGSGALLLVGFVLVEGRAAEPILPFWVVSRPLLLTTSLLGFCIGAALIGLTEYVPTFLTVTTGAPPILAGLALGALTIGWPLAAVFVGRIYLRFGFRATAILGGVVLVLGITGLAISTLAAVDLGGRAVVLRHRCRLRVRRHPESRRGSGERGMERARRRDRHPDVLPVDRAGARRRSTRGGREHRDLRAGRRRDGARDHAVRGRRGVYRRSDRRLPPARRGDRDAAGRDAP